MNTKRASGGIPRLSRFSRTAVPRHTAVLSEERQMDTGERTAGYRAFRAYCAACRAACRAAYRAYMRVQVWDRTLSGERILTHPDRHHRHHRHLDTRTTPTDECAQSSGCAKSAISAKTWLSLCTSRRTM